MSSHTVYVHVYLPQLFGHTPFEMYNENVNSSWLIMIIIPTIYMIPCRKLTVFQKILVWNPKSLIMPREASDLTLATTTTQLSNALLPNWHLFLPNELPRLSRESWVLVDWSTGTESTSVHQLQVCNTQGVKVVTVHHCSLQLITANLLVLALYLNVLWQLSPCESYELLNFDSKLNDRVTQWTQWHWHSSDTDTVTQKYRIPILLSLLSIAHLQTSLAPWPY